MKNKPYLLIIFVILIGISLIAGEDKILQPADHLKQVRVGSPEPSPDGKWILYSISIYCPKTKKRISDLFLVPFRGGKPMQLTGTPSSEGGYKWSPDSKNIAFSAKREGDKKSQLYILPISGGEARRITDIESGVSGPLWSPDGKHIAFYSSVGELYTKEQKKAFDDVRYYSRLRYYHLGKGWDSGKRRRIFLVSTKGGKATQLTKGECADEGDHSMNWHPNSKEIVFVSNRSPEWWNTIDTDLYQVDIKSVKTQRITKNTGPDHSPVYSPNGKWLAYRSSYEYNYESENYKIHIMSASGGSNKALTTKLDRNIRSIAWDKQSRGLYFTASSEGKSNLQYVKISKPDQFIPITKGQNLIYRFKVVDKDKLVVTKTSDTIPSEIYTLTKGKLKRITYDAANSYKEYTILPSEEIWVTAKNGVKLQGWLIKPLNYVKGKKFPLLLHIHGGPHGMYSPSFRFEYQLYAHHGYAVLYTNPQGSDGYGSAFKNIIWEDWGNIPFADLMVFVEDIIKRGIADPAKMAAKGVSYGGYMTNWIITHTDRFAAAVSVAGLSNMTSFWGTTDEQFFAEKEMAGLPWEKKKVYMKNSPIWYADKLKTPTMMIHGDNDWRVRTEQGEQLFTALQKMGVPSAYVNFPKEQHGVRGSKHRTLYYQLVLEWLDHWLMGKPTKLATYKKPLPYKYPPESKEEK